MNKVFVWFCSLLIGSLIYSCTLEEPPRPGETTVYNPEGTRSFFVSRDDNCLTVYTYILTIYDSDSALVFTSTFPGTADRIEMDCRNSSQVGLRFNGTPDTYYWDVAEIFGSRNWDDSFTLSTGSCDYTYLICL